MDREIKNLIEFLEERAKENRQAAEKTASEYVKGIEEGTACAYELSAKWLKEILSK